MTRSKLFPLPAKKKGKKIKPIAVNPNMPDYGKDPVFIKKHAEAAAFIKRVGLPDSFTKNHK